MHRPRRLHRAIFAAEQFNTPDGSNYGSTDSAFKLYWDSTTDTLKMYSAGSGTAGNPITWTEGLTMSTGGASLFQVANDAGSCTAAKLGRIRYNGTSTWEYCNGTAWTTLNSASSLALSSVTAASGANSINNATNAQTWNWALTGATADAFTFTENTAATGGSGDQSILKAAAIVSSTAIPLVVTNLGDGMSFRVNDETGDTDSSPFRIDASGNVVIGHTSMAAAKLDLFYLPTSSNPIGIRSYVSATPSGAGWGIQGILSKAESDWFATQNINSIISVDGQTTHGGSGVVTDLIGGRFIVNLADHGGAGATYIIGTDISIDSSFDYQGAMEVIGTRIRTYNWSHPQANYYGIKIEDLELDSTVANGRYGLYMPAFTTTASTVTNDYGIYQGGSQQNNYLAGNVGIGTATPQSALQVPDGKYAQFSDNNAGAPPAGDCDADTERGRLSIDTTNNRLYVCNGAARGWDYVALTD